MEGGGCGKAKGFVYKYRHFSRLECVGCKHTLPPIQSFNAAHLQISSLTSVLATCPFERELPSIHLPTNDCPTHASFPPKTPHQRTRSSLVVTMPSYIIHPSQMNLTTEQWTVTFPGTGCQCGWYRFYYAGAGTCTATSRTVAARQDRK